MCRLGLQEGRADSRLALVLRRKEAHRLAPPFSVGEVVVLLVIAGKVTGQCCSPDALSRPTHTYRQGTG